MAETYRGFTLSILRSLAIPRGFYGRADRDGHAIYGPLGYDSADPDSARHKAIAAVKAEIDRTVVFKKGTDEILSITV